VKEFLDALKTQKTAAFLEHFPEAVAGADIWSSSLNEDFLLKAGREVEISLVGHGTNGTQFFHLELPTQNATSLLNFIIYWGIHQSPVNDCETSSPFSSPLFV